LKNILIIDDDVKTSSKYKKWLEGEEGFNSTLINDPQSAELNFKSTKNFGNNKIKTIIL
jgi:DNA-binding NtrC family response regulator